MTSLCQIWKSSETLCFSNANMKSYRKIQFFYIRQVFENINGI